MYYHACDAEQSTQQFIKNIILNFVMRQNRSGTRLSNNESQTHMRRIMRRMRIIFTVL